MLVLNFGQKDYFRTAKGFLKTGYKNTGIGDGAQPLILI